MTITSTTYFSGEPIRVGDIVRLGIWDCTIEQIITDGCEDWEDWRDVTGEGVMLVGAAFGRLFTGFHDEDLSFVQRAKV